MSRDSESDRAREERHRAVLKFYGCGTRYLNWEKGDDGETRATKWFVLFYLPVWPLIRLQVEVLASGDDRIYLIPLIGTIHHLQDEYRVLGRCPMDWRRAAWTYAFAYLYMPLILLLPIPGLIVVFRWAKAVDDLWRVMLFLTLLSVYIILYVPGILADQLHKTRTGKA